MNRLVVETLAPCVRSVGLDKNVLVAQSPDDHLLADLLRAYRSLRSHSPADARSLEECVAGALDRCTQTLSQRPFTRVEDQEAEDLLWFTERAHPEASAAPAKRLFREASAMGSELRASAFRALLACSQSAPHHVLATVRESVQDQLLLNSASYFLAAHDPQAGLFVAQVLRETHVEAERNSSMEHFALGLLRYGADDGSRREKLAGATDCELAPLALVAAALHMPGGGVSAAATLANDLVAITGQRAGERADAGVARVFDLARLIVPGLHRAALLSVWEVCVDEGDGVLRRHGVFPHRISVDPTLTQPRQEYALADKAELPLFATNLIEHGGSLLLERLSKCEGVTPCLQAQHSGLRALAPFLLYRGGVPHVLLNVYFPVPLAQIDGRSFVSHRDIGGFQSVLQEVLAGTASRTSEHVTGDGSLAAHVLSVAPDVDCT